MVFLDTNVIIYALHNRDEGPSLKSARARNLLAETPGISIQVANETYHVLNRKFGQSREKAALQTRFLIAHTHLFDLKLGDLELALDLGQRHQLSHFDALLVANALNNGAEILYSEDMHHGLLVEGRLRILNPFLES